MKDITVHELQEKIANKDQFLLLDVREPYEYDEANMNGKLIPLGTLPSRIEELQQYKESEIVVHCRSGARSANAKAFLEQHGFSKVSNLIGGILAWQQLQG